MSRQLSIVIVSYHSWSDLGTCLRSLGELDAELIVVDNDPADERFEAFAASHPAVRFIRNSGNWGYAHGCNRGAEASDGRWLLFLNPDALDPGGQVLRLLEAAAEHPEAGIVAPRQLDAAGGQQKVFDVFPSALTLLGPVRALLRVLRPDRFPDPRAPIGDWQTVDWVSGSALLIRRELFSTLGGWHEGYWMYSEDVDLCRRARNQGHQVAITGRATLVHHHGASSRRDMETAALTRAETTISRHYYARRHFGLAHAIAYHVLLVIARSLPTVVLGLAGLAIPVRALRRRSQTARFLLAYYAQVARTGNWRSPRSN